MKRKVPKLKPRYPLLSPVTAFDTTMGPLVGRLSTYNKMENEVLKGSAWRVLQVMYAHYMRSLRRLDPGKNAALNKQRQFNDSVHFFKEIYTRYRERIRRGWLKKVA